MKKIIGTVLSLMIMFPVIGTSFVDSADARSYSSGRSSFSSSSSKSSFGSSSSKSSSSSSSKSSWGSSKSSSSKSSSSKGTISSKTKSKSYSKSKALSAKKKELKKAEAKRDAEIAKQKRMEKEARYKAKYKSKYKSKYYKPSGHNYSRYEGHSYYNSNSGFSTNLMTSVGTYLLLDSFDDDDNPVYVDAETGEKLSQSELDSVTAENDTVVEDDLSEDEFSSTSSDTQDNSTNWWMISCLSMLVIICIGGVLFIFTRF